MGDALVRAGLVSQEEADRAANRLRQEQEARQENRRKAEQAEAEAEREKTPIRDDLTFPLDPP